MFASIQWLLVAVLCSALLEATHGAGPSNLKSQASRQSQEGAQKVDQKIFDVTFKHFQVWTEEVSLPDENWLSSRAEVAIAMHKLLFADIAPLRCASMAVVLRAYSKYLKPDQQQAGGFSESTVAKVALDVMVEQNRFMKDFRQRIDLYIPDFLLAIEELEVSAHSDALETWHDLATCLFEFGFHATDAMINAIKHFFAAGSPRMVDLTWLSAHRGRLNKRWRDCRRPEFLRNIKDFGGREELLPRVEDDIKLKRSDFRNSETLWPDYSREYVEAVAKSRQYPTKPEHLAVIVARQPEPDYSALVQQPAIDVKIKRDAIRKFESRLDSARNFAVYFGVRVDVLDQAKNTREVLRKIPFELAYDFIENAKVLQAAGAMTDYFRNVLQVALFAAQKYRETVDAIMQSHELAAQARVLDAFEALARARMGLNFPVDHIFNSRELQVAIQALQKELLESGAVLPTKLDQNHKYFCHLCLTEIKTLSITGRSLRRNLLRYPDCVHIFHRTCLVKRSKTQTEDVPCLLCRQDQPTVQLTHTDQTQPVEHVEPHEVESMGQTELAESSRKRTRLDDSPDDFVKLLFNSNLDDDDDHCV